MWSKIEYFVSLNHLTFHIFILNIKNIYTGCEIAINHFTNVCPGAKFSIRVLEKLPGNGYKNGKRDKEMYKYRLEREDFWMKKLRTIYPYGLNEKSKDMNKKSLNWPVGKLFPPLARHGQRETENRNRTKVPTFF